MYIKYIPLIYTSKRDLSDMRVFITPLSHARLTIEKKKKKKKKKRF